MLIYEVYFSFITVMLLSKDLRPIDVQQRSHTNDNKNNRIIISFLRVQMD